jgi:hypothetical protein
LQLVRIPTQPETILPIVLLTPQGIFREPCASNTVCAIIRLLGYLVPRRTHFSTLAPRPVLPALPLVCPAEVTLLAADVPHKPLLAHRLTRFAGPALSAPGLPTVFANSVGIPRAVSDQSEALAARARLTLRVTGVRAVSQPLTVLAFQHRVSSANFVLEIK